MTPLERAVWTWRLRNRTRYVPRLKPTDEYGYSEPPTWEHSVPDELRVPSFVSGHIDAIGRWWPNPCEVEACCRVWGRTKFPGSKFPRSRALWMHCCSYAHVASKFGVTARELRRQVRALDALEALRR